MGPVREDRSSDHVGARRQVRHRCLRVVRHEVFIERFGMDKCMENMEKYGELERADERGT